MKRVLKVLKVKQVPRASQVLKAKQDLKVLRVNQELKVLRVKLDHRGLKVRQAVTEPMAVTENLERTVKMGRTFPDVQRVTIVKPMKHVIAKGFASPRLLNVKLT